MPYFPQRPEPQPYQCQGCGEWYQVRNPVVSCCVMHAPGDCCHYGEEKVDPARAAERAPTPKLRCPQCGSNQNHVVRSDPRLDDTYRRRRQCDDCATRFNTTERVDISADR